MNLSFIKCIFTIVSLSSITAFSQQVIPLYGNGAIPNSKASPDKEESHWDGDIFVISNVSKPTLTVYLPDRSKATGDGVIVVPGGGYNIVAAGHEGSDVAKRFTDMGIAAFVLKYRIPDTTWMERTDIGPLQDAQRAIQLVRMNAKKWKVKPDRIGILGFSAGGHLASTAATHFSRSYGVPPNKIWSNLRPDFLVLIYPVITFVDSATHTGSRDKLLGENAPIEKLRDFSSELQVTSETPPTFLVHAKDDPVSVRNTLLFADSLKAKGVPHEVLLYETGGHGFGLVNKESNILWPDSVGAWIKGQKGKGKR